jgi:transcriptional regulator with XRE-family HTH domain
MPKASDASRKESSKDRLRRLRKRAGHSPSSLAHAVGVTEGAIRQMESGQTKSPSFAVGLLLARELGVTPEFLAFGDNGLPGRVGARPVGGDAIAALERRIVALEGARRQPPQKRR